MAPTELGTLFLWPLQQILALRQEALTVIKHGWPILLLEGIHSQKQGRRGDLEVICLIS